MQKKKRELDFEQFLSRQAKSKKAIRKEFRINEQILAIDLLLKIYMDALHLKASAVHIFLHKENQIKIEMEKIGADSILKLQSISFPFIEFCNAINDRQNSWAMLGDPLCQTGSDATPRLRFAPFSQYHFQADISMPNSRNKPPEAISITNISFENHSDTLDVMDVDIAQQELIREGVSRQSGLIIANRSSDVRGVDGVAILFALRPDALFINEDDGQTNLEDLIKISSNRLVIIGSSQTDPIDMTLRVKGFTNGQTADTISNWLDSMHLVLIHKRLRRNCDSCNKSAEVTSEMRDYYPAEVRTAIRDSYSYGSRCSNCSFSGFRGTVGINSAMLIDNQIKTFLRNDTPGTEIAQYAYRAGTRPLLLDGLNRILAGQTVFSDLNESAPRISAYFLSAIRSQQSAVHERIPSNNTKIKNQTDLTSLSSPIVPDASSAIHSKGPKKILIIEDDPAQRDILQITLQGQGYVVNSVGEAEHAFAFLAKNNSVDLIVCDYMLPGMNGGQFVQNIKSDSRYKTIPVIILTLLDDETTEFNVLSGLADEFCSKDISRRVLMKRIERLLERGNTNEPSQNSNVDPNTNPLKHLLD